MTQGPVYTVWPYPDPHEGWTASAKNPEHDRAGIGATPQEALQNLLDSMALREADEAMRQEYAKRTHGSEDPGTWARRWNRARQLYVERKGTIAPHWGTLTTDEKTEWYEKVLDEEKTHPPGDQGTNITKSQVDAMLLAPQAEVHARIDTLQREVAFQLAEIKLSALPPHPGVAMDSKPYYEDILRVFKQADELALRNLRTHGVAYT